MTNRQQQQVADELRRFQSKSPAKPAAAVRLAWGQALPGRGGVCCHYWDELGIRSGVAAEFTISASEPQL